VALDKPRVQLITRATARAMYQMLAAPGDRPLSEKRLTEHIDSIRRGAMRTMDWGRAYCKEDGKTYRVNGKHTSLIMTEWDTSILGPYPRIHSSTTDYVCDKLTDVANLYSTFDSRTVARTATDTYRPYEKTVEGLDGRHEHAIKALVGGLNYLPTSTTANRQRSAMSRVEMLNTEREFCAWILDHLVGENSPGVVSERDKRRRRLMRANMIKAIYKTYKIDPGQALVFWTIVRDDEVGTGRMGQERDAPPRQLGKILENDLIKGGPQSDAHRREVYYKAVHAWNLFRTNKKVRELRYNPKLTVQPDFM
jgi:hypothetical protein